MFRTFRKIRTLLRDRRGITTVEFALTVPIMVFLFTALAETGAFLLLHVKLQHATISVADLITRDERISEGTVADLFEAVPEIMSPFELGSDGVVVVSAVGRLGDDAPQVLWQRRGAGPLIRASEIGPEGATVTAPGGLPLRADETLVAAELFFNYEPLIFPFFGTHEIRKSAFYRPRLGALREIEPSPPT